jgi:Zn-dependent oligopeptidase
MEEETMIENMLKIKYRLENMIHILSEKEEMKKSQEMKKIKKAIDMYLFDFCQHEIINDYIDIGEKQFCIEYCHKCETTFN